MKKIRNLIHYVPFFKIRYNPLIFIILKDVDYFNKHMGGISMTALKY